MKHELSIEEKSIKRTYKRISTLSEARTTSSKKLDYFFVGKKSPVSNVLTKAFESGYVAENINNVSTMLRRLIENKDKTIPDVIIADASLGFTAAFKLYRLISSIRELQAVPFLVDASNITSDELQKFRNYKFIDEIIFLKDYSKDRLIAKLIFCKKIKQKVLLERKHSNIEAEIRLISILIGPSRFMKRLFDIVVSSLLLVIFSPLFLMIMIALRMEAKGPIFYISKRAGRGYKIFNFYKFRTMVARADERIQDFTHLNQYTVTKTCTPVFIKINNDPRITRLGSFLRNFSLDELPQLINVLKGDMSIVGNRPLPLYEAATLTTNQWAERFMAPAGITGLWQIKKRGSETMSAEERILLDIAYANNNNFLYDLWIMANTPPALIQKANV